MRARRWLARLLGLTSLGWHLTLAAEPVIPVRAAQAQIQALQERIEALGEARAQESVSISSTLAERIQSLHFEDGQRVKAGQLLVQLADAEERAQLAEAQAVLAEARRQFQRLQPLAASNSVSQSLLDERQRAVETAQAQVAALEARLADLRLSAPFAGRVGLRQLSPGAYVIPGQVISTLDDDRRIKLDFPIPSRYLAQLRAGLAIEARTPAWPGETFHGAVQSLDSRVDPNTRAIQVRARLDNPDFRLKPGLLLQVALLSPPRPALLVPEIAILSSGDSHYVWQLQQEQGAQRVSRQPVQLGLRRPGWVEVSQGLKAGDWVITDGAFKLQEGSRVQLLQPATADEALSGNGSQTP